MCSRNNCFDCGMFTRNREKGIRLEGKSYFETEFYLRVFLLKLHCNCLPILQLIDDTTNSAGFAKCANFCDRPPLQ